MSLFKNVYVVYVYVKDWEAAKKFYRETLEWPVAYSDDQIGWEEYGVDNTTHVAINIWDQPEPMPLSAATIVLTVDDVYQADAELRARGVKCDEVVQIPHVVTYGTFYDPDGNRFQFAGGEN